MSSVNTNIIIDNLFVPIVNSTELKAKDVNVNSIITNNAKVAKISQGSETSNTLIYQPTDLDSITIGMLNTPAGTASNRILCVGNRDYQQSGRFIGSSIVFNSSPFFTAGDPGNTMTGKITLSGSAGFAKIYPENILDLVIGTGNSTTPAATGDLTDYPYIGDIYINGTYYYFYFRYTDE